ncbi:EF-hand calcium-binding domain-containing protein 10 [Geranomyces michiganensis]|nr:EF-hand calcium-binding domain-containing protein 10 [Geranomyces michiganensis]
MAASTSSYAPSQGRLPAAVSPQAAEASAYLQRNKVAHLIQQLLCATLYERPDDPREFMARKLEEIRNTRARGHSYSQFTRENLTALFRIFDVVGRGSISKAQYDAGMSVIGASEKANPKPSGVEQDIIRCDTFVEEALSALGRLL